jgi:NitT/TauT family transport system permease protein
MKSVAMTSETMRLGRRIGLPIGFTIVVLMLWQLGVRWAQLPPSLLVPPTEIGNVIGNNYPLLMKHAIPTAVRLLITFAAAAGLGFALGVVLMSSKRLRQAIYPHLVLFQIMPKVALAPLFIVWLGVGPVPSTTFAIFLAFFPMLVATMSGLTGTDPNAVRLCQALSATPWQTFRYVRLPYGLAYIFDGLKVASILSMAGLIVGEFVAAQSGLGYLVIFASSLSDTGLLFAAIVFLCVFGLALYAAVAIAERLVMGWLAIPPIAAQFGR